MTDENNWDEDRYANDSFDNESDIEVPEYPALDSEDGNARHSPTLSFRAPRYPKFTLKHYLEKKQTPKKHKVVQYASSSDDDNDVVFSKTIAEINTEPMRLENILSPKELELQKLKASRYIPFEALMKKLRESTDDEYYSKEENDDKNDTDDNDNNDDNDVIIGSDDNEELAGNDGENYDASDGNTENYDEDNEEDNYEDNEEDNDEDNEEDIEDVDEAEENYENVENVYDGDSDKQENDEEEQSSGDDTVVNEDSDESEREDPEEYAQEHDVCEKKIESEFKTFSAAEFNEWNNITSYESDIVETSKLFQAEMEDEKISDTLLQSKRKSTLTPSNEKFQKEVNNYKDHANNELTTVTEAETEVENEAGDYGDAEDEYDYRITTRTPSGYNSDLAFHLDLLKKNSSEKLKKPCRKSWSFSNARVREIERQNHILLKKILTQKPTYAKDPEKAKNTNKFSSLPSSTRLASAAVNRKKQQRQIDLDNQGLKRRIEAISLRRPKL